MANARYQIVNQNDKSVTIRDLGPWNMYPTVTNLAEEVVAELFEQKVLTPFKRLFYFDSEGELDEITHKNGRFTGFIHGVR